MPQHRVLALLLAGIGAAVAADPVISGQAGLLLWSGPATAEQVLRLARDNPASVIQVLGGDEAAAAAVNATLAREAVLGRARAEAWSSPTLPLAIDTANLVVDAGGVPRAVLERVCAPGGIIIGRDGSRWSKPRDPGFDDWTHAHRGPDRVRASQDRFVVPPQALQWISTPLYHTAPYVSGDGCVVAPWVRNREGSNRGTNELRVHDAWNGLLRWSRPVAFGWSEKDRVRPSLGWGGGETTPHRALDSLVIVVTPQGSRLFAALKDRVAVYDLRSGAEQGELTGLGTPYQVCSADGVLVVAAEKGVSAFDAQTLKPLWQVPDRGFDLAIAGGKALWIDCTRAPVTVAAHELRSGAPSWRHATEDLYPAPYLISGKQGNEQGHLPVRLLSVWKDVVLCTISANKERDFIGNPAYAKAVIGLGVADGSRRWTYTALPDPKSKDPKAKTKPMKLVSMANMSLADGLLWVDMRAGLAIDPANGAEVRRFRTIGNSNDHCMYNAAAPGFLIVKGTDWFPTDPATANKDGRDSSPGGLGLGGVCGSLGGLPAHGLFTVGSKSCGCSTWGHSLRAGIGGPRLGDFAQFGAEDHPVEANARAPGGEPGADDWPLLRGGIHGGGAVPKALATTLSERWTTVIAPPRARRALSEWEDQPAGGDRCAPVVVAQGVAVTADLDAGQVVSCDAASGAERWRVALPGRISAAAGIGSGLAIVGCHDGWLYALDLRDGKRVWRSRVACTPRRITAYGQVESAQPVAGPPLIHEGRVLVMAGRNSAYGDGVRLAEIDLADGRSLRNRGAGPRPGVLAVDRAGAVVRLRDAYRPSEIPANLFFSAKTKEERPPVARADVFAAPLVIPYRHPQLYPNLNGNLFEIVACEAGDGQVIARFDAFGQNLAVYGRDELYDATAKALRGAKARWTQKFSDRQIDALLIAGDQMWIAGGLVNPAQGIGGQPTPKVGGFLSAYSLADGKRLVDLPLPSAPAFNGLSAAQGRLYVAGDDGVLRCFAP